MKQNIRFKCSTETYESIATGKRTFDVHTAYHEVVDGDFYTYVEKLPDGTEGRSIVRKVSHVINTKELDIEDHDLVKHGVQIVGFVPPDYGAMSGLFSGSHFVMGFGFEKKDEYIDTMVPPAYLPPLMTPAISLDQVIEILNIASWPNGHYSLMLQVKEDSPLEAGQQNVTITEQIISVRTFNDNQDKFTVVDPLFLAAGSLRDENGQHIEPFFGEAMFDYVSDDEALSEEELEEEISQLADDLTGVDIYGS